jgi:exodeoxyribonuclease V gamma subunit
MLLLHHADELEPLLDALAGVLESAPADPFSPDLVVAPTAGLADAAKVGLGRRLGARHHGAGVVANIEFVFPGRFVARALGLAGADDGSSDIVDPWQIDHLTWHVLEELEHGSVTVPGADTSNRWALARRVADLFDRYATQRPRLIELWAQGQLTDGTYGANGELAPLGVDHHWQAHLWRAVRQRIGWPSPPEQLPGLLQAIREGALQPAVPQRVSLFGLGGVAPNLLAVLRSLAEVRDVHVFLRHPSRAAWGDAPQRLGGGLNQRALVEVTSNVEHPLLESWGRPALEAKALVNGATDITEVDLSAPLQPSSTLLQALQHGIRLDQRPAPAPGMSPPDQSLQVHACHGEVRQLEVLRDALGHAFVADPTLQPHDVLVLCDDLERFAPLVEAVFARGALPVPVRIGDRSLTTEDPVGSTLLAVLGLVASRATLSEVLGLVQHQPVRRRFGWSVEQVEQLADWCARLGTRWGLSPEHRHGWGLPQQVVTGTWSAMVDRLMAGSAMPAPAARVGLGEVPPYDDMGTDETALAGTVADMVRRLADLHAQVQQPLPVGEWSVVLHAAIDDFCAFDPAEPWRRQRVHRQVEQLVQSARLHADSPDTCAIPITLSELRSALQHSLADSPGRLSLRSGAVTVSSFLPQHGVPARVVCLLGLDDSALRSGVFDGDDVLGLHPCVGERHPRFEARQLLLDAVLSAGERLIITCNGADLTTNKPLPLTVPLTELLDVVGQLVPLQNHYAPVVVRHPRHGFNERALQPGELVPGSPTAFTFDPAMLQAAEVRRTVGAGGHTASESPWLLPPAIVQSLELQQLVEVVANPSKVYLRERLDVRLPREAEQVDDGLALTANPLRTSALGRDLLATQRAGGDADSWRAAAKLDGTLPPAELSTAVLDDVDGEVKKLLEAAAAMNVGALGRHQVDIDLTVPLPGHFEAALPLVGVVSGVEFDADGAEGVVVQVRYARARPSHRVGLALQLAALQLQYPMVKWSAVLAQRGKSSSYPPSAVRLRLRGNATERRRGAEQLLVTAATLLLWALRDAVPLFDRASEKLAFDEFGEADGLLDEDLDDQWVATLWPGLSLDQLLWDPTLPHDPPVLAGFDEPPGGLSRARLVARWLWHTYTTAVGEFSADDTEVGRVPPVPHDPSGGDDSEKAGE